MLIEYQRFILAVKLLLKPEEEKWSNIQRLQVGPIDFMSSRTHMS